MASKYCLVGNLAKEFKKRLNSGEINIDNLSKMTSVERNKFFSSFIGEENAKNVNTLFERKILSKNRYDALIKWAKEVSGIKESVRRDLIHKIDITVKNEKINILDPKTSKEFLKDLASTKIGVDVSFEEAKEITRLSKEIDKAKIEAGDFSNQDKRIKYGEKLIDMYDYVNSLQPGNSWFDRAVSVASLPKSLLSTFDLSAPFRQGFGMVTNKRFWQNIAPMFKSAFKEENYKKIRADIISRPSYETAKKAGLLLTGLGDKLTQREDAYLSNYVDKIPGIKFSERGYIGFLTKLRMDSFDDLLNKAMLAGEDIKPGGKVAEDLANMVNTFTGAGRLGKFDKAIPALNAVFFSPRKILSTINMLNPVKYLDPRISKTARKEALKRLVGMVGISASILSLAKMYGAEVETDPRSSDFGKIKIGDTRFDVTGGNGNYAVLLARLLTGQTKSTTSDIVRNLGEDYGAPTRGDTLVKYFRNKLSPTAGFVADWLYGKDVLGNPFEIKKELLRLVTPLGISDAISLAYNDPILAAPGFMASFFGFGVQSYNNDIDWKTSTSKELKQFNEKIGDEKFNEANAKYNKIVSDKVKNLLDNPKYEGLSEKEKLSVIVQLKNNTRESIFREYRFKYKQEKVTQQEKRLTKELSK